MIGAVGVLLELYVEPGGAPSFLLRLLTSGDNDTCFWPEALSFLRTNAALKYLLIDFQSNVSAAAIPLEVPAMLRDNTLLETSSRLT
jgi:hypothetical protein